MIVPSPTTQSFTPTLQSGGNAHELSPQFVINDERFKNFSLVEYPSFKEPRNSEIVLNPKLPVAPNKAKTCNFFKTRLCTKFKLGNCTYGDRCTYAHGIGDVQKPLPNWQGLGVEDHSVGIQDEELRINNNMKLCRMFCKWKKCQYGDRCQFLHDPKKFREDLGPFRHSFAMNIATTGSSGDHRIGFDSTHRYRSGFDQLECKGSVDLSLNYNRLNLRPVIWKTRLCNRWEATDGCSYGKRCFFAHGQAELQGLGTHTALESGSVSAATLKALPTPAKDTSPSKTGIRTTYKQQVQRKKWLFQLRELEKISRIYADWIDYNPPVQSSPSKV
ncbi:hypothetical protein L1049_005453 [Liquidambar formosana]|uniref:C3H1-type domain-containing protein n=1 Tax=Liquidambar formosana TaxID=63359 RepID=A0AAP0X1G4_LIQFO